MSVVLIDQQVDSSGLVRRSIGSEYFTGESC
jgi:hypothetical protein